MNAEEIDVCRNLSESAAKCMRSKRMLRILTALQCKGFIEFDPFSCTATTTDTGREAMRAFQ